jgi:TPR repeat protein
MNLRIFSLRLDQKLNGGQHPLKTEQMTISSSLKHAQRFNKFGPFLVSLNLFIITAFGFFGARSLDSSEATVKQGSTPSSADASDLRQTALFKERQFFVQTTTPQSKSEEAEAHNRAAVAALNQGEIDLAMASYQKAAEMGHAPSQAFMGLAYYMGVGVEENIQEAIKWFDRAAVRGNPEAAYEFGMIELKKDLPNPVKARGLLQISADQGYPKAQLYLALLYYKNGPDLPDYVEAYKWASLAAKAGSRDAEEVMSVLFDRMTKDQILKAQRLAGEWKSRIVVNPAQR